MRRWEEFIARRLPPFMRRLFVVPCRCCGEPANWKLPRLPWFLRLLALPLRVCLYPLRRLVRIDGLVLVALLAAGIAYGTPHVAWDYACRHSRFYNPRCQAFDYCAYYGLHGRRVVFPAPGESCPLVRLMPIP